MDVPFIKSHGLGNDFVIVDAIDDRDPSSLDWAAISPRWCDRRTGIGADGVLVLTKDAGGKESPADLRMRVFNSDGSEAQMCGNGIRCVAKYMVERRDHAADVLRVRTGRGVLAVRCEIAVPDSTDLREPGGLCAPRAAPRRVRSVTVDMGEPILDPARIPVATSLPRVVGVSLEQLERSCDPSLRRAPFQRVIEVLSGGVDRQASAHGCDGRTSGGAAGDNQRWRITCVSMGNPHAVIIADGAAAAPIERIGPALERDPMFPEGVNVHLVEIHSRSAAAMRTWERGAGLTPACGTGACAVLVAGVLSGVLDRDAMIALPGGELRIRWPDTPGAGVLMTGPALEVFRGVASVDS